MRTRHLAGGTALSVLLATASLLGVTATPAAADSAAVLPANSFDDMVVDGVHQRVFISSSTGSKIVVTDYDGTVVGEIGSEPGAAGLVLSPDSTTLYVAVPNADAISAIDTATLRETARYPIGAGSAPRYLAMNKDTVWFGYGAATQGNIGSLDLDPETPAEDPSGTPESTGTVTTDGAVVTLGQGGAHSWYSAPMVASSAGNPDVLAAGAPGQSPTELQVYDVSSGHAESKAYRWNPNDSGNLQDLTVTPDGEQILAASGAPYFHQVYRTSDLSDDGRYSTKAYPNAVAVAPDGTVAAGIHGWYDPDVYIFKPDVDQQVRTYDFPNTGHSSGADTLAPSGLAWAPDGSRLFAVSANDADVLSLRVLQDPAKAATTLTVSAPATAVPGAEVTVTGTLGSTEPF
ncbi:Ig-like domain repeat protein, partial [Streptomyces sp. NPDC058864]